MSRSAVAGGMTVLFALEREAAPFRRAARGMAGVRVVVTGIGQTKAGKAAAAVLAGPLPGLVVMAGFCGALRPGLSVGDVVVPTEVVDEVGNRWPRVGDGTGRLVTTTRIVATPSDKRALGERSGADVVDMESAAVAEACARAGVPFRAVRAVSDTAETELSPALVRLLAGGEVSVLRAGAALVRTPSLMGEFRRLARDTKLAAKNLALAVVDALRVDNAAIGAKGHL